MTQGASYRNLTEIRSHSHVVQFSKHHYANCRLYMLCIEQGEQPWHCTLQGFLSLGDDFIFSLPLSTTHCGIWLCDVSGDCRSGCREKGIQGKEVTPYILQRVSELTSGRSLQASILLSSVCSNTLCLLCCSFHRKLPIKNTCTAHVVLYASWHRDSPMPKQTLFTFAFLRMS